MFQQRGVITMAEILKQPVTWGKVIAKFEQQSEEWKSWFSAQQFEQIIFIGCGSSNAIGIYSARSLNFLGFPSAQAFASSEIFFPPQLPIKVNAKTLVVAISRSGETSETIKAAQKLKAEGQVSLLYLGCKADTTLNKLADKSFIIEEAFEEGVAAIGSFTSLLLLALLLIAAFRQKAELMAELQKLPSLFNVKPFQIELQRMGGEKFAQVVCLGSGFYEGIAGDGALKIIELAATSAQGHQALEFRHGAIGSVHPQMLAIFCLSDSFKNYELQVSREISAFKGERALICETATEQMKMTTEYTFELKSGLSEIARGVLMTSLIQVFAFYLSLAKGSNPDKIKRLSAVVHLKEI